ncbi:MAG: ribosomal protein S18 acetylase RimI-like enzyme [Planctomycetota bacterium]|jgi:ribosomal protein S18 acetylase RimI-like enzyme|uniref:GNAT family N-acetyltransferase n=1 Tax=Patiriisocius sp. Uisw_047 TaxID=3230969 RepID=UPI0039E81F25
MIRKAKPSNIDKIITITRTCAAYMISQNIYQWNEHYPNVLAFENDLARGELYVLLDSASENLMGCITISTLKDSEYDEIDWLTVDGSNYYIHRLAIHPDFQHQGYAKKLMDFAEDFVKNKKASSIRLDTFSLNTRNQQFYKHRGYQQLGSIFFPKQSDAPFYCYELVL